MMPPSHRPQGRPGLLVVDGMVSLSTEYEVWLRSWGATEATIRTRMATVTALHAEGIDPMSVDTSKLAAWVASHGWTGWTLSTYYSTLRSFFGWMHDAGHRDDDPSDGLRRPRQPRSHPRPITPEQASELLADAAPRAHAYLTLALYAGLRAHEIAKIDGADVDRDWLYVEGKGGQRAHVPTHPKVWALAQAMPRSGPWFPSPNGGSVDGDAVTHLVGRHMRKHGLTGSIHRARHAYGTMLLRSGVNIRVVQTLMRHQSIQSTQAYTAVDDDERVSAIAGLDFAA